MQTPTHILVVYDDRGAPFMQRPLVDGEEDGTGYVTGSDPQTGFPWSFRVGTMHTFEFRKIGSAIDTPVVATH